MINQTLNMIVSLIALTITAINLYRIAFTIYEYCDLINTVKFSPDVLLALKKEFFGKLSIYLIYFIAGIIFIYI